MTKLSHIFLLSTLISLVTCGKKNDDSSEVPLNIIEKEIFTDLLVDFALAESAINLNIKGIQIHKLDSVYHFNPLLERGIRKSQYDSTLQFYAAHPELYTAIYDTVLLRLSELKISRSGSKIEGLEGK